MKYAVEMVTPAKAKVMLRDNPNFRSIDLRRVRVYAREILAGNWACNGETIKIDVGGKLLDGQHRLSAIVSSGAAVEMLVVRGITDSFGVDRGKPRTLSQWLAHEGVTNASKMAAIARLCLVYEREQWDLTGIQSETTDSDLIDFVRNNGPRMRSACRMANRASSVIGSGILGAILYHGCGGLAESEPLAEWFVSGLSKGTDLTDLDAVLHLRNRLLKQRPGATINPFMRRVLVTRAWNTSVRGETCTSKSLQFRLSGPSSMKPPSYILRTGEED
jgi:hypothetical protein